MGIEKWNFFGTRNGYTLVRLNLVLYEEQGFKDRLICDESAPSWVWGVVFNFFFWR